MAGLDLYTWDIALAHTESRPNLLIADHYARDPPFGADSLRHRLFDRRRLAFSEVRKEYARKLINGFFVPGTSYTLATLPVTEDVTAQDLFEYVEGTRSLCDVVYPYAFLYQVELEAGKQLLASLAADPERFTEPWNHR